MSKFFDARLLLALSCAAALAACGGGDDSAEDSAVPDTSSAAATDKYIGTWQGCGVSSAGKSVRGTYIIGKSGTSYTYTRRQESFSSNETCTGTPSGDSKELGTLAFAGAGITVEGVAMDKVSLTVKEFVLSSGSLSGGIPQGTYKQLLAVVDSTKLREGDVGSAKDAAGYPTKLGVIVYAKQ